MMDGDWWMMPVRGSMTMTLPVRTDLASAQLCFDAHTSASVNAYVGSMVAEPLLTVVGLGRSASVEAAGGSKRVAERTTMPELSY